MDTDSSSKMVSAVEVLMVQEVVESPLFEKQFVNRMLHWMRAGPITKKSIDLNYPLLQRNIWAVNYQTDNGERHLNYMTGQPTDRIPRDEHTEHLCVIVNIVRNSLNISVSYRPSGQ